jgi:hypothetical protein
VVIAADAHRLLVHVAVDLTLLSLPLALLPLLLLLLLLALPLRLIFTGPVTVGGEVVPIQADLQIALDALDALRVLGDLLRLLLQLLILNGATQRHLSVTHNDQDRRFALKLLAELLFDLAGDRTVRRTHLLLRLPALLLELLPTLLDHLLLRPAAGVDLVLDVLDT